LCNAPDFVVDAGGDGFSNAMAIVDKVNNGDARWRELYVANQYWHGGLGHRTTAQNQYSRWAMGADP
jgi:hypothetical protein